MNPDAAPDALIEASPKMATVPRDARLAQPNAASLQDPSDEGPVLLRSSTTLSPGSARRLAEADAPQKSFTTDDLPHSTSSLLPELNAREVKPTAAERRGYLDFGAESVLELSAVIVNKVKRSFTMDEVERTLQADWIIVECEDAQLETLKRVVADLEHAFQFSKSSRMVKLATATLQRCSALVERSLTNIEQTNLMFSQCSNEILTLQDYLAKLKEAVQPPRTTRDKNEEKRAAKRAEWAVTRMVQAVQAMVTEMRDNLNELDDLIIECTKLMVQSITLLHMRMHSADFSGTGVAAGAASMVAGAVVSAAGLVAAPVSGGLTLPISLAGKGLFFGGVAALTPSSIMLTRHNQQMSGLTHLIEHLKSRLEIMNQKREEMSVAFSASEDLEVNVKQAGSFCQDAVELDISAYESVWPFVDAIHIKLQILSDSVNLFQEVPALWHYCKGEGELSRYLLPEDEEEES